MKGTTKLTTTYSTHARWGVSLRTESHEQSHDRATNLGIRDHVCGDGLSVDEHKQERGQNGDEASDHAHDPSWHRQLEEPLHYELGGEHSVGKRANTK